jgi:hypothetical protein
MLKNSKCIPACKIYIYKNVEESLTLWKDHRSFKYYILLKVAKFGIKTSKLCESSTRYLWNLIIYSGAGTDITTSIDVPSNLQSSKIAVRLVQLLST